MAVNRQYLKQKQKASVALLLRVLIEPSISVIRCSCKKYLISDYFMTDRN